MATPAGVSFDRLIVPASVDADNAAEFCDMVRVRNIIYRQIRGDDDDAIAAAELLPHYQPTPSVERMLWLVRAYGSVVGRVSIDLPQEPGATTARWLIELDESVHGRGIGSAAHSLVERTARSAGRTILATWSDHREIPGARYAARTGFGSIPRDRAASFLVSLGYELEQVDRRSDLALPIAQRVVQELAHRATEDDYRILQWAPPTPNEHLVGMAHMKSRMSTDAPSGDLHVEPELWDEARMRRHDQTYLESGRIVLVTVAQHIPSGELVAFTELSVSREAGRPSSQEDTLVLREHRGHRLGMRIKLAALERWRDLAPHSPKVTTFNAEENRPMLDINEALGFVPVNYEGAWERRVTPCIPEEDAPPSIVG